MKAKLIKENDFYYLVQDDKIVADLDGHPLKSITGKLSKQNCDEIFGVVDVEKLAEEDCSIHHPYHPVHDQTTRATFIRGFNKAMELNKDKVFTEEQMFRMFLFGHSLSEAIKRGVIEDKSVGEMFDDRIKFIQQPTEIEVEIEMKKVVDEKKVIGAVKGVKGSGDKITTYKSVSKLDENGCLILRKL